MRYAILALALIMGCGDDEDDPVAACEADGGEVFTRECCAGTEDYPDLCMEGPCGCAPEDSEEIQVCVCPPDSCWDGTGCVGMDTGPLPS